MAAGVIPIAHDSGGPRADIVVPLPLSVTDAPPTQSMVCEGDEGNGRDAQITGYLASSVEEYTVAITEVRGEGYGRVLNASPVWVLSPGARPPNSLARLYPLPPFSDCPQVLVMAQRDRLKISAAARLHAAKFSTLCFMEAFKGVIAPVLPAAPRQGSR